MKRVIECKRVCMYDVLEEKVIYIFGECFHPTLSDRDILHIVYNPEIMDMVDLPVQEELWVKNSNLRVEVFYEYMEVEQWFDKIKKWFMH